MNISAIGQDSHRFEKDESGKVLVLGGIELPNERALDGNSDADVILHAITNAVSGISGINILGKISDDMCLKNGIKDSKAYIKVALDELKEYKPVHISISVECLKPKLSPHINSIKKSISELLDLDISHVGLTATTGEGLTGFGKGEGIQAIAILTVGAI